MDQLGLRGVYSGFDRCLEGVAGKGGKIEAIKITREQTGLSLTDAKDAIGACPGNPGSVVAAGSTNEPPRSL
ncbi:MAG: ribosomal protein L7/L12 [Gammaproteobacteria bacterium]